MRAGRVSGSLDWLRHFAAAAARGAGVAAVSGVAAEPFRLHRSVVMLLEVIRPRSGGDQVLMGRPSKWARSLADVA